MATREVVIRPLRRRFSTRVALEVPWERQAIVVRLGEGCGLESWVLKEERVCWRRLERMRAATVGVRLAACDEAVAVGTRDAVV